jgi:hypothetical protein
MGQILEMHTTSESLDDSFCFFFFFFLAFVSSSELEARRFFFTIFTRSSSSDSSDSEVSAFLDRLYKNRTVSYNNDRYWFVYI